MKNLTVRVKQPLGVVLAMVVFAALGSGPALAQQTIAGGVQSVSGEVEALLSQMAELEQDVAELNDKYFGPPNYFQDLKNYMKQVKKCADIDKDGDGKRDGGLYTGSTCTSGLGVLRASQVKNSGGCSTGYTFRSSGTLDSGVPVFGGGTSYVYCTK